MGRGKKYQPEQVVNLFASESKWQSRTGRRLTQACKDAGVVEQTYFPLAQGYGGLQVDQARSGRSWNRRTRS